MITMLVKISTAHIRVPGIDIWLQLLTQLSANENLKSKSHSSGNWVPVTPMQNLD